MILLDNNITSEFDLAIYKGSRLIKIYSRGYNMRKLFLGLIALFVLLMASVSVHALALGSSTQEASDFDEDILRVVTGTFSVNATSAGTMTCRVSSYDTKYVNVISTAQEKNLNITFNGAAEGTYTVSTPSVTYVTVKARVPENLDAVVSDSSSTSFLNTGSFKVATITCTIGSATFSEDLYMQRKNLLSIDKIEVDYDDESDNINEDGDEIKDLIPGGILRLNVIMESDYDDDLNIDLDTDVTIDCPSEFDVNENSDDVEIAAGESDSVEFEIELDEDDVDDGSYKCTLTAFAKDSSYDSTHGEKWEFTFKVEKEDYDLRVDEFTLSPSNTLSCTDRSLTAAVSVKNIGSKDDKRVKIEVTSPKLSITQSVSNIDLEATDDDRKDFTLVIPESIKAGTYDITARAYSKGLSVTDSKVIQLVVPNCAADEVVSEPEARPTQTRAPVVVTPDDEEEDDTGVTVNPFNRPATPAATAAPTATAAEGTGASINSVYLVLLVVLIVLLLGGIIGLLVYLFKA